MLLETLAVVTSFGAVFAIRSYSGVLLIAYLAHVFYGVPLGTLCERWRPQAQWQNVSLMIASVVLTVAVGFWFINATVAVGQRPANQPACLQFSPTGISAGWSDWAAPKTIELVNTHDKEIVVLIRTPTSQPGQAPDQIVLVAQGRTTYHLTQPGLYQFWYRRKQGTQALSSRFTNMAVTFHLPRSFFVSGIY